MSKVENRGSTTPGAALRFGRAVAAFAVVGGVTALAFHLSANAATAGFAFLITILGIAVLTDLPTALVCSAAAGLASNYFFFPPLGTFAIHEAANWIALLSFFIASLVASRLVLRARRQAEAAERRRREVEALSAEKERLLTEAVHLRAIEEGDALKTSLLRAVSHDLATPLTALALRIERLRAVASPTAVPLVDAVADETARLRRRIENLLAMARLEARNVKPRPESTPAADLFRAAREHLPFLHGRPLTVRVADDAPEVFVDPSLALEILANLLENSHQASPAEVPIELAALRHPADPKLVRLEIADRGPGLRADAEPPSDTARRGLGLEIARSLAAASGGAVLLADRPGGGAVARIDLPASELPVLADEER